MTDTVASLKSLLEGNSTAPPMQPGQKLSDQVRASRERISRAQDRLLEHAVGEGRALLASEQRLYTQATAKKDELDERIDELVAQEKREAVAAESRAMAGPLADPNPSGPWSVGSGPEVYRRDESHQTSFFRDLYTSTRGDWAAAERLNRHKASHPVETRALGNTGAVGGSGGELAPPAWLVEDYIKLARPSRPCANLWNTRPLPSGVSSVNIPKVLTGTTTAIQSTQNSGVSQTDMTTNYLSSNITTIAGKQVVSLQLIEQSGVPIDEVVLGDLAADLTKQTDLQSLTGTGSTGQLKGVLNAGGTAVTYTDATPTQAKVYNQIIRAKNTVETGRFLPATAILMHPTRWDWFLEWTDGQGRPLIVPDGPAFNGAGTMTGQAAQGAAGTLAGLPVFLDAQLPVNLGTGTNQDTIVVARWEDLYLWESTPTFESFSQPYADSMGVLFRGYGYFAAIPNRYTASVAVIGGTGLVLPTL